MCVCACVCMCVVCVYLSSAENNYLFMLGHMSEQTQFWTDAYIIWSDVIDNCEHILISVIMHIMVSPETAIWCVS